MTKIHVKKIKSFWNKYEPKIILILGLILVSATSFEFGFIQGKEVKNNPIIIEVPGENIVECPENIVGDKSNQTAELLADDKKECLFVGSKNSDKYHVPNCRWVKNIKPENLVCFSSKEEAEQKGYKPDASCIK